MNEFPKRSFDSRPHHHVYSAGILPYQIDDGKVYFLLGKDASTGTWSDFGGKCELKDNHDIKQTAVREFFEESLNAVIDMKTATSILQDEKNYVLVTSQTLSRAPYYMFILRMPMLPDTSRDRFRRTMQYLSHVAKDVYIEKSDIRWVSLDTIVYCLEDIKHELELGWPLRKVFRKTLLDHRKALHEIKKEVPEWRKL